MGETSEARRHVAAALRLSQGRDVEAMAALALAFLGETAQSQNLARELDKKFPEDTVVQFNYLPTVNAQLALNNKDHWKAIRSLETAASYELGDSGDRAITLALYPVYVRGQAYLAAGEGQQAAREFQKILDHPGVVQNRLVGVLARLGLARAYRREGYGTQARTAYQNFFTLWKDADSGTTILKEAKTEYANLQ